MEMYDFSCLLIYVVTIVITHYVSRGAERLLAINKFYTNITCMRNHLIYFNNLNYVFRTATNMLNDAHLDPNCMFEH